MEFSVEFLSFFVIQDEASASGSKSFKHFQTLGREEYEYSELRSFLDGEFVRITKRKVEKHPKTEHAPTKIGHFIVEPGHDWSSNPNYNLFQRLLTAEDKQAFFNQADELVRMYMDTTAVRGGALIIASARLQDYSDQLILFVMKCDFEPKIARISDEKSLIHHVEMAISARNMKSIQYPYMPEPGIFETHELKIHQASHARYFEDFLTFISYEKSMPEWMNDQMHVMVHDYMDMKWGGNEEAAERKQEEESYEIWAASEKRELQEKWHHEQVMEAKQHFIAHDEDLSLQFKLEDITVKGKMAQYGDHIHIARFQGRYVVLLEGDSIQFEKGKSPIELLQPQELHEVLEALQNKPEIPTALSETERTDAIDKTGTTDTTDTTDTVSSTDEDAPPW
ncbi:DUF3900 domain-containing protein [Marinicrinis sediminis]|uniref:DUF3900 domain-containing protein n=1 Tax=Marinicrinis sediminis TaxID=1652465 RepID=A0ABW5R4Z6_9BACL